MTEITISGLVALARENDQMAINELYARTANKAYFVARRILSDEDQIADIIQESYVKAFCNLDKLAEPEKFQGWLDTIAINKCKDYIKKKKPTLFSEMENEDGEMTKEFEDTTVEFSPEVSVDYSETKRLVGEMIDCLPEDQKMCLLLFHYEERSLAEIAEIMDCPVNTVKSRLNYARKNIKNQVLNLEKKGTKLYCVPLVPFLYWFFRQSLLDSMGGAAAGAAAGMVAAGGEMAGSAGMAAAGDGAAGGAAAGSAGMAAAGTGMAGTAAGAAVVSPGGAAGAGAAVSAAGKAAGFGLKKLLLALIITSGVAIGGNKVYQTVIVTPEHTIEQFERAYNDWDMDGMVKCMSPEIQRQYRSARGLAGLFGMDPSDLFAAAIGIGQMSDIDIRSINIEVLNVEYENSTHAAASVEMSFGSNHSDSEAGSLILQKIDGKWYIME